ncbi:MAG: dienelactone hydrolase family protein [Rhodospirillales bacterium]|nr:dienelactone hydrolase family protein [Rhodospirillales bacterium]
MEQSIIDLYDEYTHAPLPRRTFLKRLAVLVGGTAAASTLLPLLENNYALAAMVAENDGRIETSRVSFDGGGEKISGYLAKPKGKGDLPAVVVIHENRGLNPHIEDVTRRLAVEGFIAFAPDMLSSAGGTPADQDKARTMIRALDREKTITGLVAAVPFLMVMPESTGRVGCVGFCWGGAMANQLAVRSPGLAAAVSYYGRQPTSEEVKKIRARLLLHYAGLDKRVNAGITDFEAALKRENIRYALYTYAGANHAFNNDTNAARYNPDAAQLAWGRTVDFLKKTLAP